MDYEESSDKDIVCTICGADLTEMEKRACGITSERQNPNAYVMVCTEHQCACMPKTTPWRWVQLCRGCESSTICKSCYRLGGENDERICGSCAGVLSRLGYPVP